MQMRTMVFSVAMLIGGAATAQADRKAPAKPVVKTAPAKPVTKKPAKVIPAGLKAAKDHGNAPLRDPSDAEEQALAANPSTGVVTTVRPGASGGMTATLGDDMLSDLVVEKQADGTLKTACGTHGKHGDGKKQPRIARPIAQTLETK